MKNVFGRGRVATHFHGFTANNSTVAPFAHARNLPLPDHAIARQFLLSSRLKLSSCTYDFREPVVFQTSTPVEDRTAKEKNCQKKIIKTRSTTL